MNTVFPMLGAQVQSLVRDLRSHKPYNMVKIKTRKVWKELETMNKKSFNTGGLGNGK